MPDYGLSLAWLWCDVLYAVKKRRENETGGSPCSRAPQLPARGQVEAEREGGGGHVA